MAQRKTQFVKGSYYHIYNRGCNKESIFLSEENYRFLLSKFKKDAYTFGISVIAYCLMPNHYHFLLRQNAEKGIESLMQSVFNSYTKAFNKMHNRTGTLFEGPFKSILVENDSYLIHLCRYIHRNPLDAGLVKNIESWQYSNYNEWIGQRDGKFADTQFVRKNFPTVKDYKDFVLNYEPPEKLKSELKKYLYG